LTKVYHPNIDEEGAICVALLKNDQWKPATRVNQGGYILLLRVTLDICVSIDRLKFHIFQF